jgi:hypothetical protein
MTHIGTASLRQSKGPTSCPSPLSVGVNADSPQLFLISAGDRAVWGCNHLRRDSETYRRPKIEFLDMMGVQLQRSGRE